MMMTPCDFKIHDLSSIHIAYVAEIHEHSFKDSAITHLGAGAIYRYYDWLINGPHPESIQTGVFFDEQLVGYCLAGKFNGALSGFLNKNRNYLVGRVLTHPSLLFNPLIRDRVYKAFRIFRFLQTSSKATQVTADTLFRRSLGILAIATEPSWQGKGIGKLLLVDLEKRARENGNKQMHLSVHQDNHQAIAFYKHLGWRKEPDNNEWKGVMLKSLT